jgi:hypothetical protein
LFAEFVECIYLTVLLSADVVTIYNHGHDKWSKVLVQIDAGYLAAIDLLWALL